jgi:hypothetical protein
MKKWKMILAALAATTISDALPVHAADEAAGPVKVLLIGDSMMKLPGRAVKKKLAEKSVTSEVVASIGSGLSRLDQFDWLAKTSELMEKHKPESVVVLFGANDNQPMEAAGGVVQPGTEPWRTEYKRRVIALLDLVKKGGAKQTVWIGLPSLREADRDAEAKAVNEILKAAGAGRADVKLLDAYALFSKNGAYSSYIIQADGTPLDVRESDGIHFNAKGAAYLADKIIEALGN